MDYQIVATLGPRSNTEAVWQRMLAAGVTGFRLNTSHLSFTELQGWLQRIGAFLEGHDPRPSLVLDLQGSKWRLGRFSAFALVPGQRLTLTCATETDRPQVLPVPHEDFFRAAPFSSGELVLDDAKIRLTLASTKGDDLVARVTAGGPILPRKGITYTGSRYRQEQLNETDRNILASTATLPGIRYALSYVKDAIEMATYRAQIGRSAFLIGKLERRPAVDEPHGVAASADELWLCRGDLGAELGARSMAETVHRLSREVGALPVPVLLAGQIFEHMTDHPAPTRSELCGAFDALRSGYAGFVLSDETAVGCDPVESCRTAALFR